MTATLPDLLDALGHHPGERISVCFKRPGGAFTSSVVAIEEAPQVVTHHAPGADIWWGVNPVNPTAPGRGAADAVTRWAALYADLDLKPGGMPSLEAAQAVIHEVSAALGSRPVAVTHSGHGFQPYWAVDPDDEAADLTRPDRRAAAQRTSRRFGRLVAAIAERHGGSVDSVFDLTRILRVPNTTNMKGTPVPVVTTMDTGGPLAVAQILDALDAYGIPAFTDDAEMPGEMVSAPSGWQWAAESCNYARKMVTGWTQDRPDARHPWLLGRATRLAAAWRYGCFTEMDHRRAMSMLNERMELLVTTQQPTRELSPGELQDAHSWAVAHVSTLSDERVRGELGPHMHLAASNTPPPAASPVGDNVTGETPGPQMAPDPPPSWEEVDLTPYLDGTFVPQVPELLLRSDGRFLLYAGRVHSFHGESESGKSWAALYAATEEIHKGHRVVMIDFESDAQTVVGRLRLLGVQPDQIRRLFSYRRPETSPRQVAVEYMAWQKLLTQKFSLGIIDGVTEALSVFGVSSKDNDEVTGWIRDVPRRLAAGTGAAVIQVDHVTKDADSRGRFALGGQAKMAALDGAAYVVEVIEPIGRNMVGQISLRVAKDRPGGIRPISGPYRKSDRTQETCVLTIDSTGGDRVMVTAGPPRDHIVEADPAQRRPFQPTRLMEAVSIVLEKANAAMSRVGIAKAVTGRKEFVLQAIDCLITDEYAADDGPTFKGAPTIRSLRPYREGAPDAVPGS